METREVKYDNIITRYNGTLYNHGEISYGEKLKDERGGYALQSLINLKLAIKEDDVDSFKNELTELIQKYAQ